MAEVLRSSRQFGGLGSHLQVVVEASASSLPSFLHSSGRSLGQVDSGEPGDQVLMQGMGLSFSSSRGGTFCSPFAFSGGYHGCLYKGMGGGAVLHPHRVSGVWSKIEALIHFISLELKTVLLTFQCLEFHVAGHSVLIRSVYLTVVSFIYCQGGNHSSSLCWLTLDLWEWCLQRIIFLQTAHIPGEENFVADFLSRGKYLPLEWSLNLSVFRIFFQCRRLLRRSSCSPRRATFGSRSLVPGVRLIKFGG